MFFLMLIDTVKFFSVKTEQVYNPNSEWRSCVCPCTSACISICCIHQSLSVLFLLVSITVSLTLCLFLYSIYDLGEWLSPFSPGGPVPAPGLCFDSDPLARLSWT